MRITPGTSGKGRAQGYTDFYRGNTTPSASVSSGRTPANFSTTSRTRTDGSYGPLSKGVDQTEEDERKKALRRRLKRVKVT